MRNRLGQDVLRAGQCKIRLNDFRLSRVRLLSTHVTTKHISVAFLSYLNVQYINIYDKFQSETAVTGLLAVDGGWESGGYVESRSGSTTNS